MWKSRLFWKLFVAYASLYLISTIAILIIVSRWHSGQVVNQVLGRLSESAILIQNQVVDLFHEESTERLQERFQTLGTATGTRITLIRPDGLVLADSEQPDLAGVHQMDNHSDREELVEAKENGTGISQRSSPTLDVPMLYVARRVDVNGKTIGFVRTARRMSFVREQVAHVQRLIGLIVFFVSLCVVALTYWMVTRIIQPVNSLTAAAEAIGHGNYDVNVHLAGSDELSQLASAFSGMSGQLRKQVTQLRSSNEQVATILSSMHEGIIATDRQKCILFANAAAGKLFDFTPEKAIGSKILATIRNATLLDIVQRSLEQSEGQHAEIDESRSMLTLAVSTALLPGDPPPGVVVVVRDISELRKLEKIRQEFVANVSHELKTPLTSIKAYAETLSQGAIEDADNRMNFVRQIEVQAERLNQLIVDILTLARVESGRESFELQTVSIRKVANDTLSHFKPLAENKNIVLEIAPSPDLKVRADAGGVRQILDNIVENAIRYTPKGGQVTVAWRIETSMAVVDVTDTGIGIREEDQPRLFERFFRVEKARSRELGGTGLGLSIVKHMTQFFGGSVSVSSKFGEGSTFSIRLPLN